MLDKANKFCFDIELNFIQIKNPIQKMDGNDDEYEFFL